MSTKRLWASPYLLLALTCLFWAGNSVIGRAFRKEITRIACSFYCWSIALVVLRPWAARPLWRQRQVLLARWKVMIFLAVLGVPTYNTINYWALHTTTATNSALINSACTVMIIAVNYLMFGVRGTARQWAGLAVSLAGVTVIVSRGDPQALLGLRLVHGDVLLLAAAL